jgi:peroxiredoxin
MRHLQKLYEKYKDKGLVILGFNRTDDTQIALDFMRENSATFPSILDSSAFARRIADNGYKTSSIPTNYIIDGEGMIVDAWIGYDGDKSHIRAVAVLEKLGLKLEDP